MRDRIINFVATYAPLVHAALGIFSFQLASAPPALQRVMFATLCTLPLTVVLCFCLRFFRSADALYKEAVKHTDQAEF